MVTCQACGTENPPGAAFCSQCARKLDPETQKAVMQTRAAHTATGISWARVVYAIIAAVVVILVIAFVVMQAM
jgi:uncharacterized membrane protein YvbJ